MTNPSAAAKQRAQVEQFSFSAEAGVQVDGGGWVRYSDYEALASELFAKDAEIERLNGEQLQIQRALASTVCEDPSEDDDPPYSLLELTHGITSLDERRRAAVKRAATARADAIKECVSQLRQRADELQSEWDMPPCAENGFIALAADTPAGYATWGGMNELRKRAVALESLLNDKEKKDGADKSAV